MGLVINRTGCGTLTSRAHLQAFCLTDSTQPHGRRNGRLQLLHLACQLSLQGGNEAVLVSQSRLGSLPGVVLLQELVGELLVRCLVLRLLHARKEHSALQSITDRGQ
jgi:hypothetical protein